MKIEDSEKKYGKRWDEWTDAEIIEHVQNLVVSEIYIPLNLRFISKYGEHLSMTVRAVAVELPMLEYLRSRIKR